MADCRFYFERLYPLQDALLGALRPLETSFAVGVGVGLVQPPEATVRTR